jgi:hypothetical protein
MKKGVVKPSAVQWFEKTRKNEGFFAFFIR